MLLYLFSVFEFLTLTSKKDNNHGTIMRMP